MQQKQENYSMDRVKQSQTKIFLTVRIKCASQLDILAARTDHVMLQPSLIYSQLLQTPVAMFNLVVSPYLNIPELQHLANWHTY